MWTITNLKYRVEDGIAIKTEATYKLESSGFVTFNSIWVRLPEPTENVIPFDQLTEAEVLDWVFANYNTLEVETRVNAEHNEKLNQPIHERLPWID